MLLKSHLKGHLDKLVGVGIKQYFKEVTSGLLSVGVYHTGWS